MKFANLKLIGIAALVSLLASGSAYAVDVNMVIDSTSGSGTISPDGLSITGAAVNDTVTVLVEVDNTPGPDSIQSLFTTFIFDPLVAEVTGGGGLSPILDEGGFGGASLGIVAQPQQKFSRPDGEWIQLAYASTGDPTSAPGPEVTTQLIFTILGGNSTNIAGLIGVGDSSVINGNDNSPGSVTDIFFSDPIMVTVPEPSSVLLSLASLASLAGIVGVRRR